MYVTWHEYLMNNYKCNNRYAKGCDVSTSAQIQHSPSIKSSIVWNKLKAIDNSTRTIKRWFQLWQLRSRNNQGVSMFQALRYDNKRKVGGPSTKPRGHSVLSWGHSFFVGCRSFSGKCRSCKIYCTIYLI